MGVKRIKNHGKTITLLTVFVLLSIVSWRQEQENHTAGNVSRGTQEEGTQTQDFSYRIDGGKSQRLELDVFPTMPSEKEIMKVLDQAVKEWERQYLGENNSADKVTSDLILSDLFCDGKVQVVYEISDVSLLSEDGTIDREQIPEEGVQIALRAIFTYAETSRIENRNLKLIQPEKGSREWMERRVWQEVQSAEKENRGKDHFSLPQGVEGHVITWEDDAESQWYIFLILGLAAAFCLEWKVKEDVRRAARDRADRLMREYPQMVDEMALMLQSGMTIFGAWERILKSSFQTENEKKRRRRGQNRGRIRSRYGERKEREKRKLYIEEMWITCREIRGGCGEKEAYEQFGIRIGLLPYRRFGSILAQNLSKGTKDVCELLTKEAREAFEMRKNHARKLGEEAGTKLLFPMLLMFVMILMVLLLPAVQKF